MSISQQQATVALAKQDSDGDGLSDDLEQSLLKQFAPTLMIGRHDCSNVPSEFQPDAPNPTIKGENGTIYGQVFPSKTSTVDVPVVEIHYYHLWRIDCGPHGHNFDTEHASVLVRASGSDLTSATWKATYWYAAAHENTVCDVSQITRASTLHAEDHGAKVWASPDKHATYLNEKLCQRGCGADRCEDMVALHLHSIINLGEVDHPMNGSVFISSRLWPLTEKMENSNFPEPAIARIERLPDTDIAWFNLGKHPAQGIIAVSSSTEQAIAKSGHYTNGALAVAGDSTDVALSVAGDSTENALQKGYHKTLHALGTTARHVGRALDPAAKQSE